MLISEKLAFQTEMNGLCEKYRIVFAAVYHISQHGAGEQNGVCLCVHAPELHLHNQEQQLSEVAGSVASGIMYIMEPYEKEIQKLLW